MKIPWAEALPTAACVQSGDFMSSQGQQILASFNVTAAGPRGLKHVENASKRMETRGVGRGLHHSGAGDDDRPGRPKHPRFKGSSGRQRPVSKLLEPSSGMKTPHFGRSAPSESPV